MCKTFMSIIYTLYHHIRKNTHLATGGNNDNYLLKITEDDSPIVFYFKNNKTKIIVDLFFCENYLIYS